MLYPLLKKDRVKVIYCYLLTNVLIMRIYVKHREIIDNEIDGIPNTIDFIVNNFSVLQRIRHKLTYMFTCTKH